MLQQEINRYQRHFALPEFGQNGQRRLKQSSVLVVGAGGLGCSCLQYLTSCGIGRIGIVDHDRVDESNLPRQILYSSQDVGRPKVTVAKETLQRLNPFVQICVYEQLFSDTIPRDYELVVDATDNFTAKYKLNEYCLTHQLPLVSASLSQFSGQVAIFNGVDKDGNRSPHYRHLYPEPPNDSPTCSEGGVLGVLPGIIGNLQALEVIKYLSGCGETLIGKLLIFDALNYTIRIFKLTHGDDMKPMPNLEVTKDEWKQMKNAHLIDIREQEEREQEHIGGEWIPMDKLLEQPELLKENMTVVLYCRSGKRSLYTAQILREKLSRDDIYSLQGGIL